MIDEKKIEEAARKHAAEACEGMSPLVKVASLEAFKSGINWFLENFWHDASEKPKPRTYLLAMYKNNKPCNEAYAPYGIEWLYKEFTEDRWKQFVEGEYITRWLYIEDLMKGVK